MSIGREGESLSVVCGSKRNLDDQRPWDVVTTLWGRREGATKSGFDDTILSGTVQYFHFSDP